jgi:SAM-dependent methyltransferase
MREFVRGQLKRVERYLIDKIGLEILVRRKRPKWLGEHRRLDYQERYVNFKIRPGEQVLDLGSGGIPFPYATVLVDRFIAPKHRVETLVTHGKPFVIADIHDLPFRDKYFDFVYCSHMLEFVGDPLRACQELMRVGKRGYVETPTLGKDKLFAWAADLQTRWHLVAIGRNLCFFEYSERQLNGIRSSVWRDIIFAKWYEPLQEVFYENQDVFNVMFNWVNQFSVFLFRLNGTVSELNAQVQTGSEPSQSYHGNQASVTDTGLPRL